ncbi:MULTISPECIES: hypothetical protein [unclassified Lentilitoribacter]|uniref:hypothetical protein n=1 Tax=unclassified Lentilitoribacter TaxID=2647570 RepID=UPI0013A6BC5A|nr:hypothetical protein [Lentilitoribacter sp. Alg239-R112]
MSITICKGTIAYPPDLSQGPQPAAKMTVVQITQGTENDLLGASVCSHEAVERINPYDAQGDA